MLEQVCPHIRGNKFIPHWPTAQQMCFLGSHRDHKGDEVYQALYGGAAGGGKSDALLMGAAQYVHEPDFSGICFRRTHTELALPGALMNRAMQWWCFPGGAVWNGAAKIFRFPSGAQIAMAYMQHENDHLRYRGPEFHYTAWDELTVWPTATQFEFVGRSRVRRLAGSTIPLRTLAATNPGGPGHTWVQRMFIGGTDPVTGKQIEPQHPYFPAYIQDNPHIDQNAYIRGLMMLHPTVRDQLLKGDWRARDPGDYFQAIWFGPLLDPEIDAWPAADSIRIRYWDLAASEKPDACRTAGVKMARHRSGVRAIEHTRAFKATPGKRDDLIVQTAKMDGHGCYVGIEIEGGSGGPAQFEAIQKRLRAEGFKVIGARPRAELTDAEGKRMLRNPVGTTGKLARADPVASCLERGFQRRGECPDTGGEWWGLDEHLPPTHQRDGIRLFAGPFTQDYLDEVEGFPETDLKDYVDATSGAWAWLEAHPHGLRYPPTRHELVEVAETQNLHPLDRPTDRSHERTSGGHWKP